MKKRIFKAYWLVVLSICMLASYTSQKEEIETNNTTPNEYEISRIIWRKI